MLPLLPIFLKHIYYNKFEIDFYILLYIYVYLFFFWGNKGNTLEPQGFNGVTKGVTVTLKIGNKKRR